MAVPVQIVSQNLVKLPCPRNSSHNLSFCTCEQVVPCLNPENPCKNGASCMNSPIYHDYHCDCSGTDYTGRNCDIRIPCSVEPCANGAACENAPDFSDYTCECDASFTGKDCDFQVPCSQGVKSCLKPLGTARHGTSMHGTAVFAVPKNNKKKSLKNRPLTKKNSKIFGEFAPKLKTRQFLYVCIAVPTT